jgi:CHAT domain-containing protein
MINQNKRIVIVPDGPLHVLPFGALVQKTGNSWQYLIEERPLHTVLSATVYSELIKQRQTSAAKKTEKTIVAFGDPKYPSEAEGETKDSGDSFVRSLVKRGTHLTPLPATREEVSMIAQIYRDRAEVYLGDEATEERAKAISKDVRYVHFACHGLLDEHFPLNSGIALTIPAELKEEKDNGILQAWEVFERVRIDADLVVLSACETGLGKEMGGEGLVGLTRAFQYAGAHTVLASLWEVADVASAELMKSFYGYLKEGLSKDEALQKAKIDMIQHPDISHPFFWGAFQLIGDWQ